jgi:hypothetical protein
MANNDTSEQVTVRKDDVADVAHDLKAGAIGAAVDRVAGN